MKTMQMMHEIIITTNQQTTGTLQRLCTQGKPAEAMTLVSLQAAREDEIHGKTCLLSSIDGRKSKRWAPNRRISR